VLLHHYRIALLYECAYLIHLKWHRDATVEEAHMSRLRLAAANMDAYSYPTHGRILTRSETLSFLTKTDYGFFTLLRGPTDKTIDPMSLLAYPGSIRCANR
jgi:hypothetical protein